MFYLFYYLILLAISVIPTIILQLIVNKYKKVKSISGYTGAAVARIILDQNGLENVEVRQVSGFLSDYYDPRTKTVNLSSDIYYGDDITALGVAAHECGHAIQDKERYPFLVLRSLTASFASFGTYAANFLIIIGFILHQANLIYIAVIFFAIYVFFAFITLPVEFNASSRALKVLKEYEILRVNELNSAKKVLFAAGLTYVAALVVAILELLRFLFYAYLMDRE